MIEFIFMYESLLNHCPTTPCPGHSENTWSDGNWTDGELKTLSIAIFDLFRSYSPGIDNSTLRLCAVRAARIQHRGAAITEHHTNTDHQSGAGNQYRWIIQMVVWNWEWHQSRRRGLSQECRWQGERSAGMTYRSHYTMWISMCWPKTEIKNKLIEEVRTTFHADYITINDHSIICVRLIVIHAAVYCVLRYHYTECVLIDHESMINSWSIFLRLRFFGWMRQAPM